MSTSVFRGDYPPGGETLNEVVARVSQGLLELTSSAQGERVLLVAHGVVAKVIRAVTSAGFDDFFDWQLANGGMLTVHFPVPLTPDKPLPFCRLPSTGGL